MKRLLPALALLSLLAGCPETGSDAPAGSTTTAATTAPVVTPAANDANVELGRYHWRLRDATDASGKRIDALFVRADRPLQLGFQDRRIAIGNSCNRIGGGYSLEGDTLTVAQLVSTEMACADPKLMALDGEIGRRLEGASQPALLANDTPTLMLTNAAGDKLVFAGEPTAETRYGGPGERFFLEVAAHTKPCSHPLIPDMQCLQVREVKYDDKGLKIGTPAPFGNFYDEIEGYQHEDGVRNVLQVDRYTIKNPPADGSSHAWVLDMVVESDATGH